MTKLAPEFIEGQKKKFLGALRRNGGFVRAASRTVATNYRTFYDWRKIDNEFAQAWDDILDETGERVEKLFYKEHCVGKKRNMIAQMFYLKCKRGYRESHDDIPTRDIPVWNDLSSDNSGDKGDEDTE